jgi:hypothetical protein
MQELLWLTDRLLPNLSFEQLKTKPTLTNLGCMAKAANKTSQLAERREATEHLVRETFKENRPRVMRFSDNAATRPSVIPVAFLP